jgi:DNA repair photolyase
MTKQNTFTPLNVSSKFAICGLPLRVDSYKTCSFNCKYCFANARKIMGFEQKIQTANVEWVKRKLHKVFDKNIINPNSFLDALLADRITWHWGGMSDPFQPIEEKLGITAKIIDIANQYDISCLFSTKSDTYYYANLNPNLHSFQLSVTNIKNHSVEQNVPSIEKRITFFKKLKNEGFKVGIRIQPFIPQLTSSEIIDVFREADYFSIEGLKLVPQNKEHKDDLCTQLNLQRNDFTQMGLLNLKPEIRLKLYKETIQKLEAYNIPYSIADNDLHYISKTKCCCGEPLVKKSTDFNNTALFFKNKNYNINDIEYALGKYKQCKANHLFASNRQENCITVWDFFNARFERESSPFSKKFMYNTKQEITTTC